MGDPDRVFHVRHGRRGRRDRAGEGVRGRWRRVRDAGDVGGQALETGLVDELDLSVAPVVFGGGKRFFGSFDQEQLMLENPAIVEGDRVLHLRYAVRRR